MEKQLSEIYNKLANKIASVIPVEWEKLYYLGEVEKDKQSWSSVMYFVDANNNEVIKSHNIPERYGVSEEIYEELLEEIDDNLIELYDCFQLNGQKAWEQVSLTLSNDDDFKIDYFYDKMDDSEDGQVEREVVWAYETFGFMLVKGSYTCEILERYLSKKK